MSTMVHRIAAGPGMCIAVGHVHTHARAHTRQLPLQAARSGAAKVLLRQSIDYCCAAGCFLVRFIRPFYIL
jgi:hypothetical protein